MVMMLHGDDTNDGRSGGGGDGADGGGCPLRQS